MRHVLLATFNLLPEGEPEGGLLVEALAERAIEARWVVWDDPTVDWAAADLVVVRATWDYHRRCAEFLAWVRAVEVTTPVLNGGDVFTWNADKAYLTGLGDLPVVPTALLDHATFVTGLAAAVERWGTVVVKPATGASGIGVLVLESAHDPRLQGLTAGPWVVQPLVGSVRTSGEISVYVMAGRAVSRIDKRPGGDEIRVHGLYGGSSWPGELDPISTALAERAVDTAARLLGVDLDYARVDLMEYDGQLVVSELELIEPGLYLDVWPANAAPFADVVADCLARPRRP